MFLLDNEREVGAPYDVNPSQVVPYYLCCAYSLRELERDRLLVRIPTNFKHLEVPQDFRFEQEHILSYKSHQFINIVTMGCG